AAVTSVGRGGTGGNMSSVMPPTAWEWGGTEKSFEYDCGVVIATRYRRHATPAGPSGGVVGALGGSGGRELVTILTVRPVGENAHRAARPRPSETNDGTKVW